MTEGQPGRTQALAMALLHAQDAASRAHLESMQAQSEAARAQAALEFIEQSVSFRAGLALVDATRSLRGAAAFPRRVLDAFRTRRNRCPTAAAVNVKAGLPAWPGLDLLASTRPRISAPGKLKDVRVAAVLDSFSYQVLGPECEWVNLPAVGFESELDEFAPHLLFVESAWRGHEGAWRDLLSPVSGNLMYLLDCCRRRGIPTVFWNKEDPAHFDHFLEAARLFDHVFTTDADCIPRYVKALGHSRVGALAFSCQPLLHGPVETDGPRQQAACFAGSWYRAYPERGAAFDDLIDRVGRVMPVAIYDRNSGRADPSFEFPARYLPMIRESVAYAELGNLYKTYQYAITVNSVQHSPTMLARRVYELLACNTVVVSNPTESVARLFEGVVVGARAGEDIEATLRKLDAYPGERDRRRLQGLRAVMSEHTAGHRMRQVCAAVLGWQFAASDEQVLVVARVRSARQLNAIKEAYLRQTWQVKRLCLLLSDEVVDPACDTGDTIIIPDGVPDPLAQGNAPQWIALMHPEDHYGPAYLQDLMLATVYAPGETRIGKSPRFSMADGRCVEEHAAIGYRADSLLNRRAMIERCVGIDAEALGRKISLMESENAADLRGLTIDGFNYCLEGIDAMCGDVDV